MGYLLDRHDIARFASVAKSLSDVTTPDAFPDVAMTVAADLIPCDLVSYNEVARDGGTFIGWLPADRQVPDNVERVLEQVAHEHPLINEIRRTGDGSPRAISDFFTEEQFKRSKVFKLLFEPMGLIDQLAIGLPAPLPVIIGLTVNREVRGFDEKDRMFADLLRPYLVQAHRAARLAASLEMAPMLEMDDRFGALVGPTSLVDPLLGRFPDWVPTEALFPAGRLDEDAREWFQEQQNTGATASSLPPLPRPFVRTAGGERWYFRRVQTRSGPGIVVSRGVNLSETAADTLRALGLSDRQASVLHLVSKGVSNPKIAERLEISTSGVKRHLEVVYRKLGVRSRAEAIALALDTLAHG